MQKLDKIKQVQVQDQQVEVFNYIGTGKPELPVRGQNRMLAEKKRNSKAY